MASPPAPLTDAEKEFFLEHGYLKLTNCFTREQAAEVCEGVWTRLGMSPTDKSTWSRERTNVCDHFTQPLSLSLAISTSSRFPFVALRRKDENIAHRTLRKHSFLL